MSVAYLSYDKAYDAAGPSVTVTKPTGTADGDILLAWVYAYNNTPESISAPEGWTQMDFIIQSARMYALFWKRASSEGADYTFTGNTGSLYVNACVVAYSGCIATGTPYDQFSETTYTTNDYSIVADGITPTVSPSLAVICALARNSYTSAAQPDGWTERFDVYDSALLYSCDKALSTTDAVVDVTITASGATTNYKHAWMLNLKEAVTATAKPHYYYAQL